MDAIRLTAFESSLARAIESGKPVEPVPDISAQIRATALRSLILQQPVLFNGETKKRVVQVPKTGLRLHDLRIVGDAMDGVKGLNLSDACAENGLALPPLALECCIFDSPINLSRARFRGLSLKGSKLIHLCANGLRVEGSLDLKGLSSTEDLPCWVGEKTGASYPNPGTTGPIPYIEPNQPLPTIPDNFPATEGTVRGRCWIELRSAHIGIDVDASQSRLVCPPFRPQYFNSPHAYYALDLRGSHIQGRLTLTPQVSDATLPKSTPWRFEAVGGVSIVRCLLGGSVCASGSRLVAIEGNAFTAQRAEIRGHVFLDYGWEGWKSSNHITEQAQEQDDPQSGELTHKQEWERFEAEGFVDLTNVRIGSSLNMKGAYLARDAYSRAGLIAAAAEIGDGCELGSVQARLSSDYTGFYRFHSEGGVNLTRATIRGNLRMHGALLHPSSFDNSFYAAGLTVFGEATLTAFEYRNDSPRLMPFSAIGPMILTSAHFKRDLNLQGAVLRPNPRNRKRPALIANRLNVEAHLLFGIAETSPTPETSATKRVFIRTWLLGSVFLQNLRVGINLDLSGTRIISSHPSGVAINLTCAVIQSDLKMESRIVKGSSKPVAFDADGSVVVQNANVRNRFTLTGAQLKCSGENPTALLALNLEVGSVVDLGPLSTTTVERLPFTAKGCVNFSNATIPTLLVLTECRLHSAKLDDHSKNRAVESDHETKAFRADSASIAKILMNGTKCIGAVSMTNLTSRLGIDANGLTITGGIFDLWEASVGFLSLKDFKMAGKPLVDDLVAGDQGVDILHLGRARIAGKLTIKMSRDKANPIELPDAIMTEVGRYKRPYANLRELEVGSLEDGNGEGWDEGLRLKLEGFVCKRAPLRVSEPLPTPPENNSKLRKVWQVSANWVEFTLFKRRQSARGHINWLNKQYQEYRDADVVEFTSSAYDRLAESLRYDGHESEAKRVLSAKLKVKRKVDAHWTVQIWWWIFRLGFDYGLSSSRALLTCTYCIAAGCVFFSLANNELQVPYPILNKGQIAIAHYNVPQKLGWKRVLVYTEAPLSTGGAIDGKADSESNVEEEARSAVTFATEPQTFSGRKVVTASATQSTGVAEVPCSITRVDTLLYALDSFIPALDRLKPVECEISPDRSKDVWRLWNTVYSILGFFLSPQSLC